MDETPVYSLPFPEDGDFANGALDLQVLAEAADTAISGVRANYLALARKPTSVWRSTVDQNVGVAGSAATIVFGSQVYTNDASFTSISTIKFPFPSSGLWTFGVMLNCVASGAATANTQRSLTLEADQPIGLNLFDYTPFYFGDTVFESSTAGGDFMTACGIINFNLVSGTVANRWLSATFQHNNTGSAMTIKAGATLFLHKLSNLDF